MIRLLLIVAMSIPATAGTGTVFRQPGAEPQYEDVLLCVSHENGPTIQGEVYELLGPADFCRGDCDRTASSRASSRVIESAAMSSNYGLSAVAPSSGLTLSQVNNMTDPESGSASFWYRFSGGDPGDGWTPIWWGSDAAAGDRLYVQHQHSDNRIKFVYDDASPGVVSCVVPVTMSSNNWYHIEVSWSDSIRAWVKQGREPREQSPSCTASGSMPLNTLTAVRWGRYSSGTSLSVNIDMLVHSSDHERNHDEFRLWLDCEEVR